MPPKHSFAFGPFLLDADEQVLLREGRAVPLPPKAFDTLLVLVGHSGHILMKDELMKQVWPETYVEENNLQQSISALRKVLEDGAGESRYIETVPRRGYRFTARVEEYWDDKTESALEGLTSLSGVKEEQEISTHPSEGGTSDTTTRQLPLVNNDAQVRQYIKTVMKRGYRFVAGAKGSSEEGAGLLVRERTRAQFTIEEEAEETDEQARSLAASRGARRFRFPVLIACALLVALVAAGYYVWLYQSRRNRDREQRAAGAPPPPQQMTLRRFATHGGVPYRVAISPDGKSLVYQQRINDKDSLWLGQIETNNSVPISQRTDLIYGEPAFAPDGSSIYFTVSGGHRPQAMLLRMPVLGGVMTELIPNVHSPVTFSPDGQQLAFLRGDDEANQNSIIIADSADGKNERTLITRKWPENFSPDGLSWSPDGKRIAVGANKTGGRDEILAVSIADGSIIKIGARDWGRVDKLAWLPDGSGLVMIARENAAARKRHIWFVPYPDGEARRITNDLNIYVGNSLSVSADGKLAVLHGHIHSSIWIAPEADVKQARRVLEGVAPRYEGVDGLAWTSDGRLLYTAYVGDNLSIWSINSDGGDLRQLTANGAVTVDNQMCVTADGRYIVFQSNRSGGLEIWRANTDGSGLKQLTTGGGNLLPSLSPDGQWVVYTSARDGKSTLWRISIDGGEATQLTDKFSSWSQVSPDGKYIAYLAPPEAPGVRLMIMPFEGGEPVKSFAVPETGLPGRRAMRWTPDGKAIIYKDDLRGLWRQALEAEKPQLVKGFEELLVRHLAWSFDGKELAYTSGPTTMEIILIENFK
ncbi:MAG: winged helix-turn-helix domain-containing protein [Acidobacteriota bacterium]|nr:winged helix-turn-helix domain-containing protein [Acidobacteriota bacterium]